jgi:glutathione S-transferase
VRELFHIALPADWARAQHDGMVTDSTRDVSLEQEGYIHCSFAEQVAATARRFYGDLPEIVLLRVDPDRVTSPIVVEDLVGSGVEFPHVYGPIDVSAVLEARTVAPDETGL